jgi:hypothetical protein
MSGEFLQLVSSSYFFMKPAPVIFHQASPPPHLQQYVQAFWHAEGSGALTLGAIADGCPGLVFHQTEQGLLPG